MSEKDEGWIPNGDGTYSMKIPLERRRINPESVVEVIEGMSRDNQAFADMFAGALIRSLETCGLPDIASQIKVRLSEPKRT